MAESRPAKKGSQQSARRTTPENSKFSAEERAAMRDRARELKAEAARADGETELLAAIAKMEQPDRGIAERVHAIIRSAAPALAPGPATGRHRIWR